MYAINATYSHTTSDGYTGMRQIPTFYLHENVQGIVSEDHAVRIARDILTSCVREMSVNDSLHVTAVKVEMWENDPAYCPECRELFSDPDNGCDACNGSDIN